MTKEDILRLRDTAEQTKVQFKERVTRDNKYDVSCEMVAQSNYRGGMIVVGSNRGSSVITKEPHPSVILLGGEVFGMATHRTSGEARSAKRQSHRQQAW